jgi:NAD-dependent SIR2 family protein deacetylase
LAIIAKLKALELGATEIHDLAQQTQHAPSSQHRFLLDMLPKGRKFNLWYQNMDATKWAGHSPRFF